MLVSSRNSDVGVSACSAVLPTERISVEPGWVGAGAGLHFALAQDRLMNSAECAERAHDI
jgi:hypothetical protein